MSRTTVTHNTNDEITHTVIDYLEDGTDAGPSILRYCDGKDEWLSCKRNGSHGITGNDAEAVVAANDPLNALVEATANEVRMYHTTRVALKAYVCRLLNISLICYTSLLTSFFFHFSIFSF